MSRYAITGKEDLDDAVAILLRQDAFTFDIEAQGENRGVPHICDVSWISLASTGITCTIPMAHPIGSRQTGIRVEPRLCSDGKMRNYKKPVWEPPPPQLERSYVFDRLRPLFLNGRQVKVCADQTVDSVAVTQYLGEVPWPPYDCVITMDWLLDENRLQHGVKPQVRDYFGYDYDTQNTGRAIETHPFGKVAHYSAMDALYEWFLYRRHRALLQADPDLAGAWQLERDLMSVLIGMRLAGADIDEDIARRHEQALSARLEQHKADIYRAAGREFNLNSNPAKQEVLYLPRRDGGQGLVPWKLTDGGQKRADAGAAPDHRDYAVDDDVLQSYPDNPVCTALRDYGDAYKLLSTYIQSWLGTEGKPGMIHDGRLHTWLKGYGTVTGRLSSSKPNLQNIPRPDTEDGRLLRSCFTAPPGYRLVVADYGQIELVVIAHYIGYGGLYDAFMNGEDPHRKTASEMFHCAIGDVTGRQRQICKAQPLDAKVLTPGGWLEMGDIKTGSIVSTPDGNSAAVTGIYPQGMRPVWRVSFSDGTSAECDAGHLWKVYSLTNDRDRARIMTLQQIMERGIQQPSGAFKWRVPLSAPLQFSPQDELPVDPYVLGALLGDGSFRGRAAGFSNDDEEIIKRVSDNLPDPLKLTACNCSGCNYRVTGWGRRGAGNPSPLMSFLRSTGLMGLTSHDKFIPAQYLRASIPERYELLRGLMDTDGTVQQAHGLYTTVSVRLAQDIAALARSLGGRAHIKQRSQNWEYKGEHKSGIAYLVTVRTPECPFWVPRKAERWGTPAWTLHKVIVSAEPAGMKECQCIMVDHPDHLYITDGFTVTHNTSNFLISYGGGWKTLMISANKYLPDDQKITAATANEVMSIYADTYPEVEDFRAGVMDVARRRKPPHIRTLIGRKRRMPKLNAGNPKVRAAAERALFSALIQGSAADLMKLALIRADNMLAEQLPDAYIVLTIHDEIVAAAPQDQAEKAKDIITEAMTGPDMQKLIRVPLKVDAKVVRQWADAKG